LSREQQEEEEKAALALVKAEEKQEEGGEQVKQGKHDPIYVVGDSHCMTTAYHTITVHVRRREGRDRERVREE